MANKLGLVLSLTTSVMLTSACSMGLLSSAGSNGSSDAEKNAIRKVVGVRNAMEVNATMYALTTAAKKTNSQQVEQSTGEGQQRPEQQTAAPEQALNPDTPNRDTNCQLPNTGGRGEKQGKRGWNTQQPSVQSDFCKVKNLLPSDSQVEKFSGNTQTGVFKLASHYCSQMMANNEQGKQARLDKLPTSAKEINSLDFSQRPVNLGKDLKESLAKELLANFAGSSTAKQRKILVELIAELSETREENGQLPTLGDVLVGVCTAALGSADTVLY